MNKPKVDDYIKAIRNPAVGNNIVAKVRFINYEGFKNIYKLPNGKDIRDLIKKLEDMKNEVD